MLDSVTPLHPGALGSASRPPASGRTCPHCSRTQLESEAPSAVPSSSPSLLEDSNRDWGETRGE